MSDIFTALNAASRALSKEQSAELMKQIAINRTVDNYPEREMLVKDVAKLMGVSLAPATLVSSAATVIGAPKKKPTAPYWIREALEYDPGVFNGFSITKGKFVNSLDKYTDGNLLIFATRGKGGKSIVIGRKDPSKALSFKYNSGAPGLVLGFDAIHECKSWPDVHVYLLKAGVPQAKATKMS